MTRPRPDPDTSEGRSPWGRIAVVYFGGVVAPLCLGKFAPVGPMVTAELGLSLPELGWLISMAVGVGAVAGLPAGYLVRRLGAERSVVGGLLVTAVAGAAGALVNDFGWLLALRAVEGGGFLLVAVACPVLVLRLAHERDHATALAIWATLVPVALALSSLAGGAAGDALGWRGWVGLVAAVTLVTALVVWALTPRGPARRTAAGPLPRPGALAWPAVLAGSFGLIVLATLPVVVLLPTLLVERYGSSAAAAGAITSVISLVGVAGGLAVGVLRRRGAPVRVLAGFGLVAVPAAWLLYGPGGSAGAAVAGAGVISLVNGFLGALVFAALPLVLERLDHADVGNGMVAQAGSAGSLVGPPLFGLVAGASGFGTLVVVIGVGVSASVGSMVLAGVRAGRRERHGRSARPG